MTSRVGSRPGVKARRQRIASGAEQRGWYLYGITSPGALLPLAQHASVQLLDLGAVAAVVERVPLEEFTPDALRARLAAVDGLEAMARAHNEVIEAVHQARPVLPARLGAVYEHTDELESAVRAANKTLVTALQRVTGHDEWAVHLYTNRASVRERIAREDPEVRALHDQIESAPPGRAYFLRSKAESAVKTATHQAVVDLAHGAFERLRRHAADAHASAVGSAGDDVTVEVLRAACLVRRDEAKAFLRAASAMDDAASGLHCETSGPWPPYSFASWEQESSA